MSKRIILAAVCAALMMSACSVDVNKLAGTAHSDSDLPRQTDTDTHSDKFYLTDTDTAADASSSADTETDSDTASDETSQAFDESKYLPMFISGAAEISLSADALYGSKEVGSLKSGERVSVVQREVMEYAFVYSARLEKFGYVRREYLADYLEETTVGPTYYIKPAKAQIYKDTAQTNVLESVSMNDMVTVIVKRTGGVWRVADKNGNFGYIDSSLLSEKKVKAESSSAESKSSKSAKSEKASKSSKSEKASEHENSSKAENKSAPSEAASDTSSGSTTSQTESKSESVRSDEESVSGAYTGRGEEPDEYTEYIVDVDVGYLSLRDRPSADKSEIIGKLYYEEHLDVIDTSGEFWYVYAPTLGMYGYVTGDPDYLYPAYYD